MASRTPSYIRQDRQRAEIRREIISTECPVELAMLQQTLEDITFAHTGMTLEQRRATGSGYRDPEVYAVLGGGVIGAANRD